MKDLPINQLALSFIQATKDALSKTSGIEINASDTILKIPQIKLACGQAGSFICFQGDFCGVIALNFTEESALEIVAGHYKTSGFPEKEVPLSHTSDKVLKIIDEVVKAIAEFSQAFLKDHYNLIAETNLPATLIAPAAIVLLPGGKETREKECIRISFSTPSMSRFTIEISPLPKNNNKG